MARSQDAALLTEAHRLAQGLIGTRTVNQMLSIWPLLDIDNLDATFERWLAGVTAIVRTNRLDSAALAARYYQMFRAATLGPAAPPFVPAAASAAPIEAITGTMLVTGPATIKRALARGVPVTQAEAVAQTESARAAMYHALDAGRETVIESVAADPKAVGWARVVSGDPCAFCAMNASRGPVYRDDSEESGGFEAHPGCMCSVEPSYTRDDWPAGSRELRELWDASQEGLPKKDRGLNSFRRYIGEVKAYSEAVPAPAA